MRSPLFEKPFVMPHGFDAARSASKAQFPQQAGGIEQYFERIDAVRQAVAMMSEHQDDRSWWLWNAPTLPWRLWPLIRDRHATLSEVFGRLFGNNEAVKLALASNLGYYTDDPDTMPFIHFAVPQASYLTGGGHYIRGGSQVLSDRLVAIIREAGGEVEAGREVETILLDGNRTRGVRHRAHKTGDVREELAPIVFGNAAPTVLAAMLPDDKRATFLSRYRGRRPSISLWTMSLGLKRHSHDFGVRHYSTSVLPSWLTALSGFRDAAAVLGEDSESRITPYGFVAYDQIDSGTECEWPLARRHWSASIGLRTGPVSPPKPSASARNAGWIASLPISTGNSPALQGPSCIARCRRQRRSSNISTLPAARFTALPRIARLHAVGRNPRSMVVSCLRLHRRWWFSSARSWAAAGPPRCHGRRPTQNRMHAPSHLILLNRATCQASSTSNQLLQWRKMS